MLDLGNACSGFSETEIDELEAIAAQYSEATGLVIKAASWVGGKADQLLSKVSDEWQAQITEATDLALRESYKLAFATQADEQSTSLLNQALGWANGERWHAVATGVTGALGGLGGVATTLIDLPVTTTLILRSIQQIAASYDEDVTDEDVRVQCLGVFGFGGPLTEDDQAETGLFASRIAITGATLSEALKVVLPRLGVVVGEKVLAQATPVLGAVAGATLNTVFSNYYQTMAHVHFRLRRLERNHDQEQVKACFERVLKTRKEKRKRMQVTAKAST
ncbi:EcsC family protein [Tsuneonella troitsensis]|uniref:EcsC family protein n=1 Tax=Tsuneonella troitsensis TaxID=292222 RepID=UPI00070B835F|nr:EcsC family protein [Tsuneonella troitsensis]